MGTGTKELLVIFIVFLTVIMAYIYNSTYYVIIRFNELGALTRNMSAYYNGFKIGRIVSIGPDKDFKHTLVRVNLIRKNINLPQNTTVRVESFPNGELYLQFVYPSSPAFKAIQRGDVLEGTAQYSMAQFMMGQNISGVTDVVTLHVVRTLQATEIANQEIKLFFRNSSKLVNENRKAIKDSVDNTAVMTENLAQMAQNLNQVSKKLNDSIDKKILQATASNIKDATTNIKDTTSTIKNTIGNISESTNNINETMKKIDDTVSQANATAKNLNTISSGLNETLSKRFGGMRVMFGTPVKQKNH